MSGSLLHALTRLRIARRHCDSSLRRRHLRRDLLALHRLDTERHVLESALFADDANEGVEHVTDKPLSILALIDGPTWERSQTVQYARIDDSQDEREALAAQAQSAGYEVLVADTSGVFPVSCLIRFPSLDNRGLVYAFARIGELPAPKTPDALVDLFEWQSPDGDWGAISHPPEMSPGLSLMFHYSGDKEDQEPETFEVTLDEAEQFCRDFLRWRVGQKAIAALQKTPPGGFYLHMRERDGA